MKVSSVSFLPRQPVQELDVMNKKWDFVDHIDLNEENPDLIQEIGASKSSPRRWTDEKVHRFLALLISEQNISEAAKKCNKEFKSEQSIESYRSLFKRIIQKPKTYSAECIVAQLRLIPKSKRAWNVEEVRGFVDLFLEEKNISEAAKKYNEKYRLNQSIASYKAILRRVLDNAKKYNLTSKEKQIRAIITKNSHKRYVRHKWTCKDAQQFVDILLEKQNLKEASADFNHKRQFDKSTTTYGALLRRILKDPEKYKLSKKTEQIKAILKKNKKIEVHNWTTKKVQEIYRYIFRNTEHTRDSNKI